MSIKVSHVWQLVIFHTETVELCGLGM